MDRKGLFVCLGATFITVIIITFFQTLQQSSLTIEQKQLGFPFELLSEQRSDSFGPGWRAVIILPKEHYSKENLDRLFRWYSARHPNREERIEVKVYTDIKNIPKPGSLVDISSPTWTEHDASSKPGYRSVPYDADFYRQGDGGAAAGGDNEFYIFSPDISTPNKTKRVVLKGRDPFATKKILETWETSNGNFKVRVISYELEGIIPPGTYYTVETPEAGSDYWRGIITFRQDGKVAIPREQVRFINDQIAFVFMGWIFAVTTDSGKTWSRWDAERDLPGWQENNPKIIWDVQISANGFGTMTISPKPQQPGEVTILRTKDYGQHWSAE